MLTPAQTCRWSYLAENNTSAVDEPAVEQCLRQCCWLQRSRRRVSVKLSAEHAQRLETTACPCAAWQHGALQHQLCSPSVVWEPRPAGRNVLGNSLGTSGKVNKKKATCAINRALEGFSCTILYSKRTGK